jgi:hypothetical protein
MLLEAGTFLLAIATVALALEAYRARVDRRQEHERFLVRSALFEKVDNERAWSRIEPSSGGSAMTSRNPRPSFDNLSALLNEMPLPSDLAAYLIYSRARILALVEQHHDALSSVPTADPYGKWWSVLDEIQTVTCLVRAHASTVRYLRGVPDGAPSAWATVQPGVPGERAFNAEARRRTGEAPPWPAGHAYAVCSPAARDRLGNAELARQQHVLRQSLHEVIRDRPRGDLG